MPEAPAFCKWLEQTWIGGGVRESLWLFPAIETAHLIGMAVLLATIGVFDLRLMGWMRREEKVSTLGRRLLPWSWDAFAVQVVTGAVLFSSEAEKLYRNPAFRLKLLLILLAGLQALIFNRTLYGKVAAWDEGKPPIGARFIGAVSLLLWVGVVTAGRFIGFS